MTPTYHRFGLCLEALDALFFRDGRPFDAAARVLGGLPLPQTLAGAVRTALLARQGFKFADFSQARRQGRTLSDCLSTMPDWIVRARFRGPWLALENHAGVVEPLLPVPQILARDEGQWDRAQPVESLPGWSAPAPLLPLWRSRLRDAKHPGGFLTLAGCRKFLLGELPSDGDWLEPDDLYGFDHRTGIEVAVDSLTAAEGAIYGIRFLVLRPHVRKPGEHQGKKVRLYAEALLPAGSTASTDDIETTLPLGGEGKYAVLRCVAAIDWEQYIGKGGLWLLATPGLFSPARPQLPDCIPDAQLIAAASASPFAVSGWDIAANGPRATRFAVPAGAVYFAKGEITTNASSLCSSVDASEDSAAAQGWGFALQGNWPS